MSEGYIVSARKYRPQTFETVVGQDHITTTLKNAIRQEHLAHAYLFCGPRGVGKTSCARILAKTINCENITPDTEACGICPTCVSFQNNTSFNVFELDAASNNSVEDIRELVSQVRFAPQQGRYKIYIIDEVHMLSSAAFNAFLKTLEEPPPYAIFILATTEKHKILPTILSRCQIFDFRRITTSDIVAHLQVIAIKEGMKADEQALHVIAQKSEGCMRDALSLLDRISSFTNGQLSYDLVIEHLNILDADFYFEITDYFLAQNVSASMLLLDKVFDKGFEGNVIIEGLGEHFRNQLLCKDKRMARLLDVPAEHQRIYFEKALQIPPSFLLSGLNVINASEISYKNAINKRLHTELCIIRLCYLLQVTQPDSEEVKKKPFHEMIGDDPVPASPPSLLNEPPPSISLPTVEIPTVVASVNAPSPVPDVKPATGKRISSFLTRPTGKEVIANQTSPELSLDIVVPYFNSFVEKVRASSTSAYANYMLASVEVYPPDEIRVIVPNAIAQSQVKNDQNFLHDHFSRHISQRIRITCEMRYLPEAQQDIKVASKLEILESMIAKNPALNLLKNALHLTID